MITNELATWVIVIALIMATLISMVTRVVVIVIIIAVTINRITRASNLVIHIDWCAIRIIH